MNDRDFLAIFLDEASEILSRWENICLTMENIPSESSINALYSAATALKDGSLSVGLKEFAAFAQLVEDTVLFLKNNPTSATPPVLAIILDCQAFLSDWVHQMHSNNMYQANTSLISQRLKLAFESTNPTITSAPDERPAQTADATDSTPSIIDNTPETPSDDIAESAPATTLGDILIEKGHVTHEQLDDALSLQNAKLGAILVAQGAASQQVIREALEIQGQRIGHNDEVIRISLRKLNDLIERLGDLTIQHSIIANALKDEEFFNSGINETINLASSLLKDVQNQAVSLKTRSAQSLLIRMEKEAKETAKTQGKRIKVKTFGESIEIDKLIFEQTKGLLPRLIRNIVSMGVPTSNQVKSFGALGAPTLGIEISASAYSAQVRVNLNSQLINLKSLDSHVFQSKGDSKDQGATNDDLALALFLETIGSDFSTGRVSNYAIELNQIRSTLSHLKAKATLEQTPGQGTSVVLQFEIRPTMIDAVVVSVGYIDYAIPLSEIREVVEMASIQMESRHSRASLVNIRGRVMPMEHLARHLPGQQGHSIEPTIAIVTSNGPSEIALLVDKIIGQQTIVVRPIDRSEISNAGFSGATILASGRPALIVQPSQIFTNQQRKAG